MVAVAGCGRQDRSQRLGWRPSLQRRWGVLKVVVALSDPQALDGAGVVGEPGPAPELLVLDPVAPLYLAVLFGLPGLDVAMLNASRTLRAKASGNSAPRSDCSFRIGNGKARRGSCKKSRLDQQLSRR